MTRDCFEDIINKRFIFLLFDEWYAEHLDDDNSVKLSNASL